MTTTEDPAPVGGWGWVAAYANLPGGNVELTTVYRQTWDQRFTAACPCGQLVDWDAHRRQPLCTCLVAT